MPNGDITLLDRDQFQVTLLDAAGATTNGVWIEIPQGFNNHTLHVKGITTATVKVNASNTPTIPANSTHDIERDSVTADAMLILRDEAFRWIKARVSAWTSGTISVFMVSRR